MYKSVWGNKVLCEREAGQMNPGLLKKEFELGFDLNHSAGCFQHLCCLKKL